MCRMHNAPTEAGEAEYISSSFFESGVLTRATAVSATERSTERRCNS